jgi:hypothetical protein
MLIDSNIIIYATKPEHDAIRRFIAEYAPAVSAISYVGGSATFDNKNVGSGKTVTATGLSLSGADAANYTVNATVTTTANIMPATVTPSITAANKVYDGTTAATITSRSLSGVIGTDDVSLTGGTATFNDANVGTNKLVTATGLRLSGTDAGNYQLSSTTATTTASILYAISGALRLSM